jgi:hypothetical protein
VAIPTYFKWWKEKHKSRNPHELTVFLDEDSLERFERLKSKIRTFDNDTLVTTALKCLEDKTDKIIRMQVRKRIWSLRKEGLNPEQIAGILNKRNVPTAGDTDGWDSHAVSVLLREEYGEPSCRIEDAAIRKH